MTYDNFTIKAQDAILKAQQIAAANSQQNVDTSHLLRGIIETDEHVATFLFEKCTIDMSVLQRQLETLIQLTPKVSGTEKQAVPHPRSQQGAGPCQEDARRLWRRVHQH
jgi:ATP-dependent Clp protease ATP-binding subunit ClpB